MASDAENLTRRVRENLNSVGKLLYKRFTTTSAGAADGTTIISTELASYTADALNGTTAVVTSGDFEGQRRKVEDHGGSPATLTFTNNPFPGQIASGVTVEVSEGGVFDGEDIKQALIRSINELAGLFPKAVLRDYIALEEVSGVGGIADPPSNAIDIHYITIDGKAAIEIPPEESNRLLSGQDVFLETSTTNRYLYVWRGKDSNDGELRYVPATNKIVAYHKIPLMTGFDSSGETTWPQEFWDVTAIMATSDLLLRNEDTQLAGNWLKRAENWMATRGLKVKFRSYQEGTK